jgi:hypothetical protein
VSQNNDAYRRIVLAGFTDTWRSAYPNDRTTLGPCSERTSSAGPQLPASAST